MRKTFLILLVIVCLAVAVWNGYLLFTDQTDSIAGWIILAMSIGVLLWNISVLRSYRVRAKSVVAIFVVVLLIGMTVAAYVGIEPFAGIKDVVVLRVGGFIEVGDEAAAHRTVRATISAFNSGRGDRLADLTTQSVGRELMDAYSIGALFGGVRIVDYSLTTDRFFDVSRRAEVERRQKALRDVVDLPPLPETDAFYIRVRGGLRTVFGTELYDKMYVVENWHGRWIVTRIGDQ